MLCLINKGISKAKWLMFLTYDHKHTTITWVKPSVRISRHLPMADGFTCVFIFICPGFPPTSCSYIGLITVYIYSLRWYLTLQVKFDLLI